MMWNNTKKVSKGNLLILANLNTNSIAKKAQQQIYIPPTSSEEQLRAS